MFFVFLFWVGGVGGSFVRLPVVVLFLSFFLEGGVVHLSVSNLHLFLFLLGGGRVGSCVRVIV